MCTWLLCSITDGIVLFEFSISSKACLCEVCEKKDVVVFPVVCIGEYFQAAVGQLVRGLCYRVLLIHRSMSDYRGISPNKSMTRQCQVYYTLDSVWGLLYVLKPAVLAQSPEGLAHWFGIKVTTPHCKVYNTRVTERDMLTEASQNTNRIFSDIVQWCVTIVLDCCIL